jgi:hypothetical protein
LCAGAEVALVAAALDERDERDAVAHEKRADALGSAELVTRDRDQVGVDRSQVDPLWRLDRVGVQHRVRRPVAQQRAHFGKWLHDTGLVVDEHH